MSPIKISRAGYVLALSFTATALVLNIPAAMEPTWEKLIQIFLLGSVLLILGLASPALTSRRKTR
ncbi:hypothetical protein [Arachnia propionica]|uniref:Uncharacterized protein n=1 Tax=Arachnia propionica TaxID=1750 RepID=A0A3P1WRU7_9ACTN|nr:hypothetical protein [Arachnia propionica]RRD48686.1 hypothetical protein EII35_11600 [Arachnia propionica]